MPEFVEIDAKRVVHRGPSAGLTSANPLNHPGKIALAVLGDAHLGVEVDERDLVLRVVNR